MAKRMAASELTKDNWDEEDEPEEKGVFKEASQEKLEGRVLKKGKRRILDGGAKAGASPFSAFVGFTKTSTIPTFNFSSDTTPTVTNGNSGTMQDIAEKGKNITEVTTNSGSEYYRKLKCLNECFQQWIQKHLAKSPYCDFTPVCRDYERHLRQLGAQFPVDETKPKTEMLSSTFKLPPNLSSSAESASFTFGLQLAGTTATNPPVDGASSRNIPVEATKIFSFSAKAPVVTQSTKKEETGDDSPPKNEFTPVEEQDTIYNKRCKLFYKKDDNFVDKGVGVLYLKKLESKTQLLIRADTNLGNVLLNIVLSKSLPIQRTGKNNVLVVCVPNPPIDSHSTPEPIPMLIRVKTSEDADELQSTLVDHAT